MDAARQEVRDNIINIRKTLDDYRGKLQVKQLKKLGIRVTGVPFTANKFPQFRPCFFIPRGLQLANEQESEEGASGGLQIVKEHTEITPHRVRFPSVLSALHTRKIDALKQEGFDLSNNTTFSRSGLLSKGKWPFSPGNRLSEYRYGFRFWQISLCLEDTTHTVPHAIIDVLVDTSRPPCGLTASEVTAILRVMEIRMGFKPYEHHFIIPLLVLSYLGPDHARIIQAHHDGDQMTIQYSRTVRLDNMSVRNLLGYYCSQPVGMTTLK